MSNCGQVHALGMCKDDEKSNEPILSILPFIITPILLKRSIKKFIWVTNPSGVVGSITRKS